MAKVIKSVSLDPEQAAYLDATNGSALVNELLRQRMVREAEERANGGPISDERRAAARAWARDALSKAKALKADPQRQERRRRMGFTE
jgi:hypothetical protein